MLSELVLKSLIVHHWWYCIRGAEDISASSVAFIRDDDPIAKIFVVVCLMIERAAAIVCSEPEEEAESVINTMTFCTSERSIDCTGNTTNITHFNDILHQNE